MLEHRECFLVPVKELLRVLRYGQQKCTLRYYGVNSQESLLARDQSYSWNNSNIIHHRQAKAHAQSCLRCRQSAIHRCPGVQVACMRLFGMLFPSDSTQPAVDLLKRAVQDKSVPAAQLLSAILSLEKAKLSVCHPLFAL